MDSVLADGVVEGDARAFISKLHHPDEIGDDETMIIFKVMAVKNMNSARCRLSERGHDGKESSDNDWV